MKNKDRAYMVSRRDFLLGAVRRVRQNVDDVVTPEKKAPVSGIGKDICEADRLFGEGQYDQAVELYKNVLSRESHHKEARVQTMICQYRLGQINPAKVCAQQVLKQEPGNQVARLYLGLVWAKKGNLDKAMQAWSDYFDLKMPRILREVNLQKALFEAGEGLECEDVVASVEEVMEVRSAQ
ncbi:MAG: tetratricopeptide repeat protein [Desulfoplanes sp.]